MPANTFSSPIVGGDPGKQRHSYTDQSDSATPDNSSQHPQYRRVSQFSSPPINLRSSPRDSSPPTPAPSITNPRSRRPATQPASPSAKSDLFHYDGRRPSATETSYTLQTRGHTYRPSNLQYASSGGNDAAHVDTPPESAADQGRTKSLADGSESGDSNTAPSTVWDELDNMKSRIRRLELTGKLPPTSGAAVSNGSADRPHTATTTTTTISSSPNQHRKPSASSSETIGGPGGASIHPLLHSALARCKPLLNPALYSALKATASDALELAAMTGSSGLQGTAYTAASIMNGATVTDRQVRRRADNMCRSLTELCIVVCDGKSGPGSPAPRATSGSRYGSHGVAADEPPAIAYARQVRASLEPEGRSPSRALNRIEARRASRQSVSGASHSPREPGHEGRPQAPPQSEAPDRISSRPGTSLLRARSRKADDANQEDDDPTLHAPSRAMTEAGGGDQLRRQRRIERISREYTSQHPLPGGPQSSPLQQPSALRRANGSSDNDYGPAASPSLLMGRERKPSRLSEGLTPSKMATAPDEARSEERRQRLVSLGQYASGARRVSLLGRGGTERARTSGVGVE